MTSKKIGSYLADEIVHRARRFQKAEDNSMRIRYTFVPRGSEQYTFDALILTAFFKSSVRANRWWSVKAAATREIGGDVIEAQAPQFQAGEPWPYSVRVVQRSPEIYAQVAMAARLRKSVTLKVTEMLDGGPMVVK